MIGKSSAVYDSALRVIDVKHLCVFYVSFCICSSFFYFANCFILKESLSKYHVDIDNSSEKHF